MAADVVVVAIMDALIFCGVMKCGQWCRNSANVHVSDATAGATGGPGRTCLAAGCASSLFRKNTCFARLSGVYMRQYLTAQLQACGVMDLPCPAIHCSPS